MIGALTRHPVTETLRLVVDASPLVMAIWSLLGHIWTSPTRSPRSTRQHKNRRIAPLVQEERPQDRHTLGEGWQTDLDPHAGGTPALPGD
jgi:hypothetical protein